MNYYGPKELETDEEGNDEDSGGYHYTKERKRIVRPLGYCRGGIPTTREEYSKKLGASSPEEKFDEGWDSPRAKDRKRSLRMNKELMERFGHKFHEDGHDTPEEAIECYTEYCIDTSLIFYDEEDTDFKDYYGASTHGLSEPVEGDDVPADVKANECEYGGCEMLVGYPTASISGVSIPQDLYLCSGHCNEESVRGFWSVPKQAMGNM